ncbi:hypothetical protein [Methanocalculus sp.]|uniref:hypothetical protein n=1 Tax=Methanocalculus sp. TaxID=2004547 RepID=UPI0026039474|nr:hypothetical protein [Methanocalculus sp.]MDG6249833.1 hypothetical protein [Methanocalculus sp.]
MWDEGLEIDQGFEDLYLIQFYPEEKNIGTEFRLGGEDRFRVLMDLLDDLEAPSDRPREGGVLIDHLLPDIDKEDVAGLGLANPFDGAIQNASNLPFYRYVCVCSVEDSEPEGH